MTLLHLQLFWSERQQTFLGLDELPELSERQKAELQEWCNSRRKLLRHEAHSQPWVKVADDGNSTEIILSPNGSAKALGIFHSEAASGQWNIQDGVLFVQLQGKENLYEYRVIGNARSNIHSAAEYINGRPHSLVKLIQVKPC